MINKNILFGLLILPYGGGGNCLFGTEITEDKTIPIFRGNVSMVEVKSADTNPSKLPEIEPIQAGKIDTTTTRCFDLFCVGKYEQGNDLKLDIQSADKIPNLVTKDADGNPVFCEPKPMCTIRGLKGHNVWVNIELKTITTNATSYMCLGIKKQGDDDYYDILYTGNMSRYVDVLESDVVELIPLISSTELPTYTAVKAGETAKIVEDTNTYDFGSVYRVHISLHKGQWLTGQKCDLYGTTSTTHAWNSYSGLGMGSVIDQNGEIHQNQLMIVNYKGVLARSSDGIHWFKVGELLDESCTNVKYGNGVWATTNYRNDLRIPKRSIDGGKTWQEIPLNLSSFTLGFVNGVFMMASYSLSGVYSSPDAENWTKIGRVDLREIPYILIYGNNKWICGSLNGYICSSRDGKGTWDQISDELHTMSVDDDASNADSYDSLFDWSGGCYANGYFYVIRINGLIARSSDGVKWERVFSFDRGNSGYHNITYYKNKLWAFSGDGKKYVAGLFNPDGTIESLKN